MIKTWRHAGLQRFLESGSKAGIQPRHANRLQLQLGALNRAQKSTDMAAPGWRLHELTGNLAGHWSVDVSGDWRLTFKFAGTDAISVDYRDSHQAQPIV
jgi:proteic killer suppression protein